LDLKQIKQIIELMKRSELTEFAVEEEGFKLKICRGPYGHPVISSGSAHPGPVAPDGSPGNGGTPRTQATPAAGGQPGEAAEEQGVGYIKSPMVGTFYRAPSPESKPFVDANSKVVDNSVVCIIEAMKIMNEIQAELKGTIVEVLVENGQPVEYGQRLFKLRLAS
jgi:acetyl-CoA carboxylase biotin carboxyl carrier protein